MAAWLDLTLHWTTRSLEMAGIAVIVAGALTATVGYLRRRLAGDDADACYRGFRIGLGRSILLGLEFLVAADIIATVAIEPSLDSVAVLGGIVVIRIVLSLALEVEIDGRWPWKRQDEPARPRD